MTLPNPPVYQPSRGDGTPGLEINYPGNAQNGDMVPGTYGLSGTYSTTGRLMRMQTTIAAISSPPYRVHPPQTQVLVRMRRTNNLNGLDQEPGISSSGPTLPILFGRGSMMARSGSPGQLSVGSGVTVRAVSIAATALARTVGRPYAELFASRLAVWNRGVVDQHDRQPVVLRRSQPVDLEYVSEFLDVYGRDIVKWQPAVKQRLNLWLRGRRISGPDISDTSVAYPLGRPLLGPTATIGDQAKPISIPDPTR